LPLWSRLAFPHDDTRKRFYVSIHIETEVLAKAFEFNDLNEALAPLRCAVEAAIAAKTEIDALLGALREKAKRR